MRWYVGKEREPGETEQPFWGGSLRLRLPFIHYPWEWPDFIEGAILCVVPMGVIAAMQGAFGISYEVGLTMVIVNNFMYLLHTSFGDPAVAGWITAGIPLYMAFVADYATEGSKVGAIQAMCALQLIMAVFFLVMAVSGGAKKITNIVPPSLKSGILLGAGISAIIRTWSNASNGIQNGVAKWSFGGGIGPMSFSFMVAVVLSFFILWSPRSLRYRKEHKWFAWVAKYGIAPTFIIGYIVGMALGEVSKPTGILDQGWIFVPKFADTFNAMSPLSIGWPSGEMFAGALSTAIIAYVLAFGDILVAQAIIDDANESRKDELVVLDPNRTNFWVGIRNLIESIIWPYLPLAGPQWTAGQALVVNRFKTATPEEEYSYWGGATGLFWGMSIIMLIYPIVLLVKPALPFGFGLTMAVQGYLCCYLAMEMISTNLERGISGMMGGILATRGATWALLMGILFYLALAYGTKEVKIAKDIHEKERKLEEAAKK